MPTGMAIEKLKNDLVVMGEMCENALDTAIMALLDRDQSLACYVIDYDSRIDEEELSIDRQCTDLISGGNLTGDKLRFVTAALKIANDLERVGDLAVEIAEHVLYLIREKSVLAQVIDFMDMVNQVAQMMRESIQALLEADTSLAWKILDERRIADDEMQIIFRELLTIMENDSRTNERCCHILFIAQFLLRVAEKAANIAEEVIYMEEGVTVRHHLKELRPLSHAEGDNEAIEIFSQVEKAAAADKLPRDEARAVTAKAHKQAKTISREEVHVSATGAKEKVLEARKKMLKMRANRVKAN